MTKNGKAGETTKINIALQGGGSHGAFSCGVLDRLLGDGRLEISAVSSTSAGAMNTVALADGFVRGGVDGARQKLDDFFDLSGELDDGFKPVRGPAPGRRVKEFLAARKKPEAARRRA